MQFNVTLFSFCYKPDQGFCGAPGENLPPGIWAEGGRGSRQRRPAHLELLPQRRGVALRVHAQQLLVGDGELVHGDGGLTTQAGLQDGVVDENVLLLEARTCERKPIRARVDANTVMFALN